MSHTVSELFEELVVSLQASLDEYYRSKGQLTYRDLLCDYDARIKRSYKSIFLSPEERGVISRGLCGANYKTYCCTRPKFHSGNHVATVGPYQPHLKELARWKDKWDADAPADAPAPEVRPSGTQQRWCGLCGEGNECKGHP